MGYKLLTGATGMLGRYLLRDLLLRDQGVAVLVRPTRLETAEQRIDAILSHWEQSWGRSLPRPVILNGDVTQPKLGLDAGDRKWLQHNCGSVLHSAASLTFYEEKGEPSRTNVEGTRNVLELCHEVGIRLMEYVSTAYVCGLRTGRAYESELEVGQELGNDYERSKVAAEKLVRSDDSLDTYTIFRPSIIVGDSQTGYTPTFHGFYTPLRVIATLLTSARFDDALEVDYLRLLGLTGEERKNFVPVDWVSDATVSILSRVPPQKQVYALTSPHPVTAARLRVVFEQLGRRHREGIEQFLASRKKGGAGGVGGAGGEGGAAEAVTTGMELFEKKYVDQFAVYRSYWRDDPDFDCSNRLSVLPDLPCPEVTDEMLTMLCRYALDVKFGWPPPRYESPEFSVRDWIRGRGKTHEGNGSAISSGGAMPSLLGITVTGPGGGCWTIYDNGYGPFCYSEGRNAVATEARMTSLTFRSLVRSETSLEEAVAQGRIVVYGEQAGFQRLQSFVRAGAGAGGPPSSGSETH